MSGVQPYYADWMRSRGFDPRPENVPLIRKSVGNWEFISFITRARQNAKRHGLIGPGGAVTDRAAYAALVHQQAITETLERFPA